MIEHDLVDVLDARGAAVDVGPPPLADMTRSSRAVRTRRHVVVGAVAAAVVVVAGAAVVGTSGTDRSVAPVVAPPSVVPSDGPTDVPNAAAAAGFRLVGLNGVAIAVPRSWATNALTCGTPQRDTVEIDVFIVAACLPPYPADVDSVAVRRPSAVDVPDETWSSTLVGGVDALLSPPVLVRGDEFRAARTSRTLYVPDRNVVFIATSSYAADARVDEILSRVVLLGPDQIAVPDRQGMSSVGYADDLSSLGLTAEVVDEAGASVVRGQVLSIAPAAGTVVAPGTEVTVTVRPQVERLEVSVRAAPGLDARRLGEAELRNDPTVVLEVGGQLTFVNGSTGATNADFCYGSHTGDALDNTAAFAWRAIATGTAEFRITCEFGADSRVVSRMSVSVE